MANDSFTENIHWYQLAKTENQTMSTPMGTNGH